VREEVEWFTGSGGMNPPDNRLILGSVKNLDIEELRPFFVSLDRCGYEGSVCIFVSDVSERTQLVLREQGATVIPIRSVDLGSGLRASLYPLLFEMAGRALPILTGLYPQEAALRVRRRLVGRLIDTINNSRYFWYLAWLQAQNSTYSKVMLTDVRDVVFQRDPFDFDFGEEVCFFLEDSSRTIGTCPYNSDWFGIAFGAQTLSKMEHSRISCSGTTIGSCSAVLLYLQTMVKHLMCLNSRALVPGIDQAVHNYILYSGLLDNILLFENHTGPVLTMGWLSEDRIKMTSDGQVLRDDGSMVQVLHQYDRHPAVAEKIMAQLCL
jgi:hypothetical protein